MKEIAGRGLFPEQARLKGIGGRLPVVAVVGGWVLVGAHRITHKLGRRTFRRPLRGREYLGGTKVPRAER